MNNALNGVSWVTRVLAAAILAMAGFAKLSADPASVHLFTELLGAPELMMYAVGGAEVLAALLLLIPKTLPYGCGLALVLMLGAIGSHVTKLGVSIAETGNPEIDEVIAGPGMFIMAIGVLVAVLITAFIKRADFPCKCCGDKCDSDATVG